MKLKKYNNGGTVKLQNTGKVPEAVVTAKAPSINTIQGKIAAQNMAARLLSGQDNTGRVPSSYYNYITGELNGAIPTRQAINNVSKELLPYAVGLAFGPAGAVASMAGEAINMGVNAATKGDKDSWGDLFVNEEKHPIWNTVMDFTNPGYLLVGGQPRPSRASNAGVAMLRGESAKRFLKDAAKAWGERIENTKLSDSPVVQNILAGKIGWGPRTTETLYHHSNAPLSELDPMFKSWDVVERGAPRGKVWLTEDSGTAGFLAERPYHQTAEVTLTKPMVQVGEAIGNGKNAVRNDIVRFAQDAGADGIQFKGIADNQLPNQNVTASFKPERLRRTIIPGSRPISMAERLGIPKGDRGNLTRFQKEALEDLEYFNNTDNYRFYWDGEKFIYSNKSNLQPGVRKLFEFDPTPKYYNFNTPFGNLKFEPSENPSIFRPTYFGTSALPSTSFGEADLYGHNRYGKIILTSPYTDAKVAGLENADSFEKTLSKDTMKRFWANADQIVPKGTYVSGDEGALPLGDQLKRDWDAMHSHGTKWFNDGTTQKVRSGSVDDLLEHLFRKYPYKTGREGLSVDSYMAILKQGNRPGHALRFSPDGFSTFNAQGVENKWIYDLHQQMLNKEIPQSQFIQAFNKWVEPYGGMKAVIKNGEVIIPHPFIRYNQGGKVKSNT